MLDLAVKINFSNCHVYLQDKIAHRSKKVSLSGCEPHCASKLLFKKEGNGKQKLGTLPKVSPPMLKALISRKRGIHRSFLRSSLYKVVTHNQTGNLFPCRLVPIVKIFEIAELKETVFAKSLLKDPRACFCRVYF